MSDLERLGAELERHRRELLDLSARNRLIHAQPAKNAKAVRIIDERSDEVWRILVTQEKAMSFLALPENRKLERNGEDDSGDGDQWLMLPPPEDDELSPTRHKDTRLQTSLTPEVMQRRLLGLFSDARTQEEETGANPLFLAVGTLCWYESDTSDKPRTAPLILLPVQIDRSDARHAFRLKKVDEDISTNLSLQARLKQDFGIVLPDIPDAESMPTDWGPSDYFTAVEEVITRQQRWTVQRDDMLLWLFSFTRFLMYRDLDPATWPEDMPLVSQPLVSNLLLGGFRSEPPLFGERDRIDDKLPPQDMTHVVDADSSQAAVIEEVRQNRNLVVQGPPGTGKSQTIVNVIAAAVRDGKSVLFVAEKQAALDVVLRRLEAIGLGGMCLGLHSHFAKKKEILAEINRVLNGSPSPAPHVTSVARSLAEVRDRLNRHASLLHNRIKPAGISLFRIVGELARLREAGVEPSGLVFSDAIKWETEVVSRKKGLLRDAAELTSILGGSPQDHHWRGVGLPAVPMPSERQALTDLLNGLQPALETIHDASGALKESLAVELSQPASLSQVEQISKDAETLLAVPNLDLEAAVHPCWTERFDAIKTLVETGRELTAARQFLTDRVADVAWEVDVAPARVALAAHGHSWFRWLSADYRRAVATLRGIMTGVLPKTLEDRLKVLETLRDGQRAAKTLSTPAADSLGAEAFGSQWNGERSDWEQFDEAFRWQSKIQQMPLAPNVIALLDQQESRADIRECVAVIREQLPAIREKLADLISQLALSINEAFGADSGENVPLASWIQRVSRWQNHPDEIAAWIRYRTRREELAEADLQSLAQRLDDGSLSPAAAIDQFELAYFEGLFSAVRRAGKSKPHWKELVDFAGPLHERIVKEFRRLDLERIVLAQSEVRQVHHRRAGDADANDGINLIRREVNKKQRHVPIRKLLAEAGEAVQQLKPVFLMSPMSVARFLTPGKLTFDLLLIDEASQVRPEDALGAIARARQVVVVGDDKQLPPTDFFRMGDGAADDDGDESTTGDLESILGLCKSQGLSSRMLMWHYRSRHESLIAVSNHEYYDDKLLIVPGSEQGGEFGLTLRHVTDGIYDRGRSKTNRIEARAVAEAVIEHAQRYGTPDSELGGKSLGVATLSATQADAVLTELEGLRREHPETERFFVTEGAERFFVKNLENVQGDERDVIFVSVGYGKDSTGYFSRTFGPLNRSGGERRLNVLMTRARERCVIFTSMIDQDLDLTGISSRGPHVLKEFLRYARTGFLEAGESTGLEPDSVFEEQVAKAIRRLGYQVEPQVGVAGFRIDLAVKDPDRPGRYLLGIECDGARYHSARWARDRDRLRQAVLESRGWNIHRVWSLDWFANPGKELERIREQLERIWTPQLMTPSMNDREDSPEDVAPILKRR